MELQTVTLPITVSPEEGGKVEPEVRKEVLLLAASRARSDALDAGARGDHEAGAEKLREAIGRLESGAEKSELAEELQDLQMTEASFPQAQVAEEDMKYMKQRMYDSNRSRSSSKDRDPEDGAGVRGASGEVQRSVPAPRRDLHSAACILSYVSHERRVVPIYY